MEIFFSKSSATKCFKLVFHPIFAHCASKGGRFCRTNSSSKLWAWLEKICRNSFHTQFFAKVMIWPVINSQWVSNLQPDLALHETHLCVVCGYSGTTIRRITVEQRDLNEQRALHHLWIVMISTFIWARRGAWIYINNKIWNILFLKTWSKIGQLLFRNSKIMK